MPQARGKRIRVTGAFGRQVLQSSQRATCLRPEPGGKTVTPAGILQPLYTCVRKMNISHIDHLVLTVRDIDATLQFYESVLGMERETFGAGRVALKFGNQKLNLHRHGHEFEPKAKQPVPGSQDLCFITETDPAIFMAHVQSMGVEIIAGPVPRTGACGPIVSIYFRDPDGNLIEVARYENDT